MMTMSFWPVENIKTDPKSIDDLLAMCKKSIQELHDRWTQSGLSWGSLTHDPNAVLEEIDLFIKEGQKIKFREFL